MSIEQQKLAQAGYDEAVADALSARIKAESEIEGVNTTVASVRAQLDLARFYLGNTTMVAPEDGRIINLQVRAGMVSGEYRIGAIPLRGGPLSARQLQPRELEIPGQRAASGSRAQPASRSDLQSEGCCYLES
ncbi:MAG TPA: hypothetical protein VIS99_13615 [Terrimicrobiaceae bacterium]